MLTDTQIRNAKAAEKPYKLKDNHGLYVWVSPTGTKLWRYRYRIAGKENIFSMGEYPALTLAEARAKRAEARELVKQGTHPTHNRRSKTASQIAENANTFKAIAMEWIEQRKAKWSPYYLRQVERFLDSDAYPSIGNLPIRTITAAQILAILKAAEKRKAITVALLLRQWISAIFRFAASTLRADADPAAALKGAIHRNKVKHHRPLTRNEIRAFSTQLEKFGGHRATYIALRLMLLTFVRTVELRAAKWPEFDLEKAEWRIPAERMKMREMHIVPLSRQAVELLRELYTLTGGRDFLFPNQRNPETCMSPTTLNRALERMGFNGKESIGFSAHGFRATASTLLNELGDFRDDVIERQLAHADRNKIRASYNQAQYIEERRMMMQKWADIMDEIAKEEVNSQL